jgi:hypothetical protein
MRSRVLRWERGPSEPKSLRTVASMVLPVPRRVSEHGIKGLDECL